MSETYTYSGEDLLQVPDVSNEDPSLQGGWKVVYTRDVPIELRLQLVDDKPQEVGELHQLTAKVLVLPNSDHSNSNIPKSIRVELTSETDLFFHYSCIIDEKLFHLIKEEQRLMVDYSDMVSVLSQSFQSIIQNPNSFIAVLIMDKLGAARLDFIQNVSFKFVELLSVPFTRSSDEVIRSQISFRYSVKAVAVSVMTNRLSELVNLVKSKNPSLLLAMKGGAPPASSSSSSHAAANLTTNSFFGRK
jgi:Centriolar protein SAS N-terminal